LTSSIVVDSSPLIVLIKSGLDHLLPQIFESVYITAGVRDEILAGGQDDKAADQLLKLAWLTIAPSPDVNE
jgi:predicted nucleic acid-binding protein